MSKDKGIDYTWDRVSNLSLPNQVRFLCDCIDEIKNAVPGPEPKPVPKPPEK